MENNGWIINQDYYEKRHHGFYETIFSLCNGYIGVRHTIEHESEFSIPGAFIVGVYDSGIAVPMEIVNIPLWLPIQISIGGIPINFDETEIILFNRYLNMYEGIITTFIRFKDLYGRITSIQLQTFVHIKEYHLGVVSGTICAENYSSDISITSYIDYRFGNSYMGGFLPQIQIHHCQPIHTTTDENGLTLIVKTLGTNIQISQSSKLMFDVSSKHFVFKEYGRIGEKLTIKAEKEVEYNFCKIATFYTSNDSEYSQSTSNDKLHEYIASGQNNLINSHKISWKNRWDNADIKIDGDMEAQKSIRFCIYQLLQSCHPKKAENNIPSKGLSSEYHSGHFFFNTELYYLNFFNHVEPAISSSLLKFRYNTLNAAKKYAEQKGYSGAKYPEEADHLGQPAAAHTIVNYFTGESFQEWSGLEVKHISADVVYGIHRYYEATLDHEFIFNIGLEILIETSRFGVSLLDWDKEKKKFVILKVMCLDEYHYHVDNHYYTNYMVKWNIEWTIKLLNQLNQKYPDKIESIFLKTSLTDEELEKWETISSLIYFPERIENNLIEQFEGYYQLPDQTISHLDENLRPILNEDDQNRVSSLQNIQTRLIKQADIIMLLSMFPENFSLQEKRINYDFYKLRTVHESSLSAGPYGLVAGDLGEIDDAYIFYMQSARFNLNFIPKDNYKNGLHLGAYASAWQIIIRCFAGLQITSNNTLIIKPGLPNNWNNLTFKFHWRSNIFKFLINRKNIEVYLIKRSQFHEPFFIVENKTFDFSDKDYLSISYQDRRMQ